MEIDNVFKNGLKIMLDVYDYSEIYLCILFDIKSNTFKAPWSKQDLIDEGYPCLSVGNVARTYDSYTDNIIFKINYEKFSNSNKLNSFDIFMNLEDFSKEHIGKVLYYYGNDEVAIAGHGAILTLKEEFKDLIDLRYVALFMNYNFTFRKQILGLSTGTNVLRIKVDDILGLKLLIPSVEKQKLIVERLEKLKRVVNLSNNKISIFNKKYQFYKEKLFNFERGENGI